MFACLGVSSMLDDWLVRDGFIGPQIRGVVARDVVGVALGICFQQLDAGFLQRLDARQQPVDDLRIVAQLALHLAVCLGVFGAFAFDGLGHFHAIGQGVGVGLGSQRAAQLYPGDQQLV